MNEQEQGYEETKELLDRSEAIGHATGLAPLGYLEHMVAYAGFSHAYVSGAMEAIVEVRGPVDFDGSSCRCSACGGRKVTRAA